jgi:hypothetical protein
LADLSVVASNRTNYIARHWRGDLSLPVSYWINGSLLGIGYVVGARLAVAGDPSPSITYAIGLLILGALGFAMQVWQLVGTWRSADKHMERGGRRICANLAKLSVVFGWLGFIRSIVEFVGGVAGS